MCNPIHCPSCKADWRANPPKQKAQDSGIPDKQYFDCVCKSTFILEAPVFKNFVGELSGWRHVKNGKPGSAGSMAFATKEDVLHFYPFANFIEEEGDVHSDARQ